MKLNLSRQAYSDLDRLHEFLIGVAESKRPADKALLTIKNGLLNLLDYPEMGVALDDGTDRRELTITFGRHAYLIRYIPDYSADKIHVLRIWHSREKRE